MNRNNNLNDSVILENECSICLKKYNNDKVYLNCNHSFHRECINNWKERNDTCPICRKRIIKINEAFNIKKFIFISIASIFLIVIAIFLMKLLLKIITIFLIPLASKILEVPKNFLINFLQNLYDIIILIIIIIYKICKKIVLWLFSFVVEILKEFVSALNGFNSFLKNIKKTLEKISKQL